jgi:hypothetical protein
MNAQLSIFTPESTAVSDRSLHVERVGADRLVRSELLELRRLLRELDDLRARTRRRARQADVRCVDLELDP